MMNLKPSDRLYTDEQYRHAQYIGMLNRMLASAEKYADAAEVEFQRSRLAKAADEYVSRYGVEVPA